MAALSFVVLVVETKHAVPEKRHTILVAPESKETSKSPTTAKVLKKFLSVFKSESIMIQTMGSASIERVRESEAFKRVGLSTAPP